MDEKSSVVVSDGLDIDSIVLSNGVELCVGDSIIPNSDSSDMSGSKIPSNSHMDGVFDVVDLFTVSYFCISNGKFSVVLKSPDNDDDVTMSVNWLEECAFRKEPWLRICK